MCRRAVVLWRLSNVAAAKALSGRDLKQVWTDEDARAIVHRGNKVKAAFICNMLTR